MYLRFCGSCWIAIVFVSMQSGSKQVTPDFKVAPISPMTSAGKIAFTSRREGVDHIYIMDGDGSNAVQLTSEIGRAHV